MQPHLRDRTDLTLDQIATLVSGANSRFAAELKAEVRSVLVQTRNGGWQNFISTLRLFVSEAQNDADALEVDMGAVVLLRAPVDPQKITSGGELQASLTLWRKHLGAMQSGPWQATSQAQRWPSRGHFGPEPVWVFRFHEPRADLDSFVPVGPFVNAEHRIFADRIGALAAMWLDDTRLSEMYQNLNEYRLIIPDLRSRFGDIQVDGERVHVKVEQRDPELRLFCGAVGTSYAEEHMDALEPVCDGAATVRFPRMPKVLRMWVVSSEGEWLDLFEETPHSSSWGEHLLRPAAEEHEVALQQALDDGEGPDVEFKAWIATHPQDKKSAEFLKTLVAFLNTQGGDVYIGVDDHARVVSISRNLEAEYGSEAKDDLKLLQEAYTRALLKMITDRIAPKVRADLTWLDYGGIPVLRVRVGRGLDAPYEVTDSREIFVRRGATNRKASPTELGALFSRTRLTDL
jgi:hypothetical protein